MTSWRDGMRRVNGAPAILAGVWLLTLLVTVPLAAVLHGMVSQHLGASLAADAAATGVNYDWMQEFAAQATGVGVTLKPTIIGFAAVLDNLSAFIDDAARPAVVVAAASVYILLWMFVAGGILDRFARDRPTGTAGFFASCGTFFFRFLRLGALQWLIYALLFGTIHPLLFDRLYPRITHELTVERTAFIERVVLYVVFGGLVALCTTVFDYAKIRAVVEDRRSMLSAAAQSLGFIRRNAGAVSALFVANFAVFVLLVAIYSVVAPGARGSGVTMWSGFLVGQTYIIGRLWVKLLFWASETALFQARLAHAGYVSRPAPVWPDSPMIEQIQ
jgi:hypothetical protein